MKYFAELVHYYLKQSNKSQHTQIKPTNNTLTTKDQVIFAQGEYCKLGILTNSSVKMSILKNTTFYLPIHIYWIQTTSKL